jgi:type 1 fimbriae regulatory protein FimB
MIRYIPFKRFESVVRRLRKLVRSKSATARRDALAMILGLHGLRVTEVCNLLIGDLDVIDELLLVRTLKNGKPRRVSLGPGVFKELRRLGAKRAKTEPLFTTGKGQPLADNWLQKQARRVTADVLGGEGIRFHGYRHTFAMRLYHETKDMQRVKGRLGHRSLQSTQVYVDAYGELDDSELRKIGSIDVLPSLQAGRKGLGKPGIGTRSAATRSRRPAPSARSSPKRNPDQKTHVSLGNRSDSHEMVRAKTGSDAVGLQKTVALDPNHPAIRLFIHNVDKALAESAEEMRRSG